MSSFQQQPILSAPDAGDEYSFPGSIFYHRAKSAETNGVFSVIELVTEPGKGVSPHVHQHEDELVYILEGELEVMLGDQKMNASAGIMALLPRGIPHGFTNVGSRPSRVLDVILPGAFDNYFVEIAALYRSGEQPTEKENDALSAKYSIKYL